MASSSQSRGRGGSPSVYLSFYGPDLGTTFLSHLRSSLSKDGIRTYLDFDAAFHIGEDAASSRFKAFYMRASPQFKDIGAVIVIFSKNYASFSWCLNDLWKIMDRSKSGNPVVLPVFYKVDPTDVRTPSKIFSLALDIHENKFGKDSAKVKRWREALSEAGSLSGCCLRNHGSDAELIKSIVERINYLLGLDLLQVPRYRKDEPRRKLPDTINKAYLHGVYANAVEISKDFIYEVSVFHRRVGIFPINPHSLNEVPSLHLDDDHDNRWSYDVFLSFRGPDTRHTIISHLYHALCQKGILTFKDNERLEAGQRRSELFEALQKSRIAIVMFSKNYARSKWCLEELKLIIKRKEHDKLTVIPIFYRVSPEEIRLHGKDNGEKGCYQIAMEEMEVKYGKNNPEMVESWKKALWRAGDLIGFTLTEGKDEGNCMDEVIGKVIKLLNHEPMDVAQCPIGIKARLKEFLPLLKLDDAHLRDVHMVGIYGPGGVGKTTLSKAICNDIMEKFDDWCFLSEVRETPLIKLQKRLLRKLLSEKDLRVSSIDEGKTMIRRRLRHKRVLVIIDDVDKPDQLDALAGGIHWFGEGSRIIITTRNSHVLDSSGVRCRYEVKCLHEAEAEYLFRYHASSGRPETLHIEPSVVDRFLVYAKGLPLALVVLGRSLLSRSASDWESLLEKLEQYHPQDIVSTLKISIDGLDKDVQEIFLDIACFFKGRDSDYVVKVLASFGFDPTIVINILVERCLVTNDGGKFQMHNLVEAMGKSIARGKCSKDDEIPNRIWTYEDFCDILLKNMGQEKCATKGIILNSVIEDEEPISPVTFEDFKRLRLLIFRNGHATEGSLNFPSDLRWFEWRKYSAPAIDFRSSRKLVGIDMRGSKIRQILGKDFKELKYLNLYNCKFLEALPNLSKSSHLMDLNLTRCEKLSRLDDSIGSHDKLVHLNLQDCCNITEVSSLLRSKYFKTINFSGCSKLHKFPAIKEKLVFLKELNLEKTALKELPDSICNLVAVKDLNLSLCKELSVIPSSIFKMRALERLLASGCPKLEMFPRNISRDSTDDLGFPNLVLLNMQYCNLQEVEFLKDLACFETLKEVYLSGNAFAQVPECIREFKKLEQLWLCNCKNLVELPEVPSNVDIYVMGCRKLRGAPCINAFVRIGSRSFQADFSNCHNLHLNDIGTLLSLEEIRQLGSSAEVIVARKDFPRWMDFQITDYDSNYTVPLPEGFLEDDILGLAVSVTFRVMRRRAGDELEQDFFPEVSFVVGSHKRFPRSDIDQFDGSHTWFVFIPRRPRSEYDLDYHAEINWRNITLGFEAQCARLEICGVRMVCKNELDDQMFKVQKIEALKDDNDESESESESESANIQRSVFNPILRNPIKLLRCRM